MPDNPGSSTGEPDRPGTQPPRERYQPPAIEDLDTSEGPSVTAAGVVSVSNIQAAPREL